MGDAEGEKVGGEGETWLKAVGIASRFQPVVKNEVLQNSHSCTEVFPLST